MTTTSNQAQRFEFQAETKELLNLMVHSIYSNKDIFLRELISNSSDALDKLRVEALTHPEWNLPDEPPAILLEVDKNARTLSITDNGIGMSRDEVIHLIGTIAKSGTREFLEVLKAKKAEDSLVPPELIGQFGVGFYSTFMVADKVTLTTRRAGETEATRWESTGDGTYTLETVERPTHGTTITLHLKPADSEDALHDYTDQWVIRDIVKRYSDFVAYPIQMDVEHTDMEHDEEGKPIAGTEKTVTRRQTLNSMKAIWTRPESEVSQDEYIEFYKHISHDWNEPMLTVRMKMEGTFEAQALLFVPSKAPFDLFFREMDHGVQLYVKRVFIMDKCQDLMPNYLRFVKGVVDSEDLSLNISREILQQNRQIQAIRKRLVKKVLGGLENLRNTDKDKYLAFWQEFGRVLKEGLFEDHDNQAQLLDLAFFHSTHDAEALVTIRDYLSRMKPDQEEIYYITAESRHVAENSPHLEAFREKGYEVLLLTDPVDEVWVQSVFEFEGKRFQSVGKGTVELGTEAERKAAESALKEQEKSCESLLAALKNSLGDDIQEVRLSNRLVKSASCLVGNPSDITPQMEKLLKAMNQPVPKTRRILELNPNHPVLAKLQAIHAKNADDPALSDYAYLLYGQALLAEGSQLPDPARFSTLVARLMVEAGP